MSRWRKLPRLLFSVSSLLLSGLLIGNCVAICRSGGFSRAEVAEHLQSIAWVFPVWLVSMTTAFIFPAPEQSAARQKISGEFKSIPPEKMRLWRFWLYFAAGVLVLAGIWNGGSRDVLVKAIQICTECVGLG